MLDERSFKGTLAACCFFLNFRGAAFIARVKEEERKLVP